MEKSPGKVRHMIFHIKFNQIFMNKDFRLIYRQLAECGTAMGWTYKIQLKQAESNTIKGRIVKVLSVVFSALVSVSALSAALKMINIQDNVANFITAILGVLATIAVGLDNKLDFLSLAKDNIKCGAICRDITKSYRSLLTDIKSGQMATYDEIIARRDELQRKELDLLKDAPITFRKAVKKAEEHLMKARDNETTDEEIKSILGKQFLLSDDDFQE